MKIVLEVSFKEEELPGLQVFHKVLDRDFPPPYIVGTEYSLKLSRVGGNDLGSARVTGVEWREHNDTVIIRLSPGEYDENLYRERFVPPWKEGNFEEWS